VSARSERYAEIRADRAQGVPWKVTCERIGISHTYYYDVLNDPDGSATRARKDSYRRPCPGYDGPCGRLMDGANGFGPKAPRLCAACANKRNHAEKTWTRETVIAAIQRFAKEHGRPPTSTEWITADPENGYPPRSSVYVSYHRSVSPFAKWADAIEAAGFPRPLKGRKLGPQGRGGSNYMREYIVLKRAGEGWTELATEARDPERAIEAVADEPGQYVAILKRLFVVDDVKPITALRVSRNGSTPA